MRIGILTDIHANLPALETVLADVDRSDVDYIACLGDIVGYGGRPNECCDLIRQRAQSVVVGNHDAAMTGRMDYDYYRRSARDALEIHKRLVSPGNFDWLAQLPYEACVDDVRFCHGVPPQLDSFEYLFNIGQVDGLRYEYESQARFTFVGHSHLCKAFGFSESGAVEVLRTRFEFKPEQKYIISAGSVGQPRDYDNRACWSLLDLDAKTFEYKRLEYDIEQAVSHIRESNVAPAFGRRLFLGI
jgi:diadenosine tetraphosphatase ApaH/serine/threonine PP2A family protein phosphatase